MSTNTLNARSAGEIIVAGFFNDFNLALSQDFVGRDASGVAAPGQNLGTVAIPWGSVFADNMIIGGNTVDPTQVTTPSNIVVSGKTRSGSNQPAFITPNGAAASFELFANTTHLVLNINGVAVTVSTDIVKSSLTLAPSSQNTALLNDTEAAGQEDTRLWGEAEHYKPLTIDTVGTNITALVGKWAAFKIVGSSTEYFIAFVASATSLEKCRRGYFYDSALAPVNRTKLTDNNTITLLSLGWVFMDADAASIDVTYTNPTWAYSAPSSPVTGDYWYDLHNQVWKRYDGVSFVIINRVLVGQVIIDTANCIGARSIDFYKRYSENNTLDIEVATTEIVQATKNGGFVNVAGFDFRFEKGLASWNITTNLAPAADMYQNTEQSSTLYYLYLADTGQPYISDISPYHRSDLLGPYHPHNPWRCVGMFYNDGSGDITLANSVYSSQSQGSEIYVDTRGGEGATNTKITYFTNTKQARGTEIQYISDATLGDSFVIQWPGLYSVQPKAETGTVGGVMGVSKNSNQLTTGVQSITASHVLEIWAVNGGTVGQGSLVWCKIGETIRAHIQATASLGSSVWDNSMHITKVNQR